MNSVFFNHFQYQTDNKKKQDIIENVDNWSFENFLQIPSYRVIKFVFFLFM